MLICLHELLSDIQYRYLHQWHHSVLYASYPNVHQAAGQIKVLDHKLKIILSRSVTLSPHKPLEQLSFKQLLSLKKECIIDEWPQTPPLHSLSLAWYWHDRLTMYGIHYLMMQIILHNQNNLDLSDCPSLISLADTQFFSTDIKHLKAQLPTDDFLWLKKMEQQFCLLPWQIERNRLTAKIKSTNSLTPCHDVLHKCVNLLLQTIPASRHEEIVLTSLMVNMRSKMEAHQSISTPFDGVRDMILMLVKASCNYREWIIKLIDIYLNEWEQIRHLSQLKREHRLWQHQSWQHPESWILRYIDTHLDDIRTTCQEAETIHKPLFYWSSSVQDFIGCFHPLIARGKIQYRGNSDMVPIVTMLHQLFEIPKSRGVGLVSCPSLLTYFKNVNSNAN